MLKIIDNNIHTWSIALADLRNQWTDFLNLLSTDEIARAQQIKTSVHHQQFVLTRGILRNLLGLYLGISPKKICFQYNDKGKPFIINSPIHFNLSHSDDYAVCAFCSEEIGIDVEKMKETFKMEFVQRFFSDNEYQYFVKLPDNERPQSFSKLWARKEALAKGVGEGLLYFLKNIILTPQLKNETVIFVYQQQLMTYTIQEFFFHKNFASAIAVKGSKVHTILHCNYKDFF